MDVTVQFCMSAHKPSIGCLNTASQSAHQENLVSGSSTKTALLVRIVNQIVALEFGLSSEEITRNKRGPARISRARQIAFYLMHTSLSLPLVEIGKFFEKDRTTVGHACRVIEDLRDNPVFDDKLVELENTLKLVKQLSSDKI